VVGHFVESLNWDDPCAGLVINPKQNRARKALKEHFWDFKMMFESFILLIISRVPIACDVADVAKTYFIKSE
jgi:hypothetical protein